MNCPAYPNYKDSGVEWLGEIPEHWTISRFKYLLSRSLQYGANEAAEMDDPDLPRYVRITDINDNGTLKKNTFKSLPEDIARPYLLNQGDLLLARSGATVGKTFLYDESWGRAAYAGYLIRAALCDKKIIPKFAAFFCHSRNYWDWLQIIFIKATIQNVSAEKYSSLVFGVPPLEEQKFIVTFLNRKTKRIDKLIAKKERQIELLQEKRAALISHSVTKGLNPNVKMKDSGVEWLGEIPEHWEVKPIKCASKVVRGKFSHRPRNDPRFYDGLYPFIQTGDIVSADKYITTYQQTLNNDGLSVSKMFPKGTLVMSIAANIGDLAILKFDACFPDSIVGFIPELCIDHTFPTFLISPSLIIYFTF